MLTGRECQKSHLPSRHSIQNAELPGWVASRCLEITYLESVLWSVVGQKRTLRNVRLHWERHLGNTFSNHPLFWLCLLQLEHRADYSGYILFRLIIGVFIKSNRGAILNTQITVGEYLSGLRIYNLAICALH